MKNLLSILLALCLLAGTCVPAVMASEPPPENAAGDQGSDGEGIYTEDGEPLVITPVEDAVADESEVYTAVKEEVTVPGDGSTPTPAPDGEDDDGGLTSATPPVALEEQFSSYASYAASAPGANHVHTAACYRVWEINCPVSEAAAKAAGHVHDPAFASPTHVGGCYQDFVCVFYNCGNSTHSHSLACNPELKDLKKNYSSWCEFGNLHEHTDSCYEIVEYSTAQCWRGGQILKHGSNNFLPLYPDSSESVALTNENAPSYADRVELPSYAEKVLDVLEDGLDDSGQLDVTDNSTFKVDRSTGEDLPEISTVTRTERVEFSSTPCYSSSGNILSTADFSDFSFQIYTSSMELKGDQRVDYTKLKPGDVVKTSSYNGVYITKTAKGDDYSEVRKETATYASTLLQAFDMDHPEVFWLSGKGKLKLVTVKNSGGVEEVYYFLVLADGSFTMCAPAWTADGAIAQGIARRDKAVAEAMKAVTAKDAAGRVKQLNTWLTTRNEYNRSADLTKLDNEPHECLSALEGRTGKTGPVCDGYSRAMKVLCDKLGVPCVLETGYAKSSANSSGEYHMWNSIEVNNAWYGADVTWNDPIVKDISQAKSGKENENYLLVGSGTKIGGLTFSQSHPATNQLALGGVAFSNSPALSSVAFSQAASRTNKFTDVKNGQWYTEAVLYAVEKGLMQGTGATTFSPGGITTRAQIVTLLYRYEGEPKVSAGSGFSDVTAQWSEAPVKWASTNAIVKGVGGGKFNPNGKITCQEFMTILHRYAKAKGYDVSASGVDLAQYAGGDKVGSYAEEPMRWAIEKGIVTPEAGKITPTAQTSRAQAAVYLMNFCENAGKK